MFMDNIKNEKEVKTLIQAVRICNQNIGTKFSVENSAMSIVRTWKQQIKEGIELPNQQRIWSFGEKETYKY